MNELNQQLQLQYKPTLAIMIYDGGDSSYGDTRYYLESHQVGASGEILEGKPLRAETIAGIVDVFRDKHQQEARISGAIPGCLLHYAPAAAGDYTLIWHRPAAQKMMHFTGEGKLKSGLAFVPPMLFTAKANKLSVYALTTGKRPGPKSKVHAAPFYNVNAQGLVCLGSAKVKQPLQKTFDNVIAYWEDMFWGSKFSAIHNDNAVSGGLLKLWRTQLRKPDQPFPLTLLAETKVTYQSIINGRK